MFRFREGRSGILSFLAVAIVTALSILLNMFFGPSYPHLVASSLVILFLAVFVVGRYGLVSPPSLIMALLTYPAMMPLLAAIYGVEPSLRAAQYQSQAAMNEAVFLSLLGIAAFVATLQMRLDIPSTDWTSNDVVSKYRVYATPAGVAAVAAITVVSALLTTPGPTILSVDYQVVIDNYFSWAQFAGSLFMGAWIMLWLFARDKPMDSWETRLFIAVTVVSVLWLLLHARRNESFGVLAVFAIWYTRRTGTTDKQYQRLRSLARYGVLTIALAGMVIVEHLRNPSRSLSRFVIARENGVAYLSPPGGAHNIYSTWQATVSEFGPDSYLYGESFLYFPIQTIPSAFWAMTPYARPPLFNELLDAVYAGYPGGAYILVVFYANFGTVGVVLGGVVLGLLASFSHRAIVRQDSTTFLTGVGAAVVVGAFRSMWYHPTGWTNTLQAFTIAFAIYVTVTNTRRHVTAQIQNRIINE